MAAARASEADLQSRALDLATIGVNYPTRAIELRRADGVRASDREDRMRLPRFQRGDMVVWTLSEKVPAPQNPPVADGATEVAPRRRDVGTDACMLVSDRITRSRDAHPTNGCRTRDPDEPE